MTALVSWITGAAGQYLGYAALAGCVAAGGAWLLHEHDLGVKAQQQVAIDTANAAALAQDHVREVAALEATAAEAQRRASILEQLKVQIHALPPTTACVASPVIRLMLDGLRRTGSGSGASSSRPGQPVSVP